MGIITGAVAAYLVGCVPTARVAARLAGDRPWSGAAALAADAAKGFVALWLLAPIGSIGQALTLTALVAGDQWPVAGETGRTSQWVLLGAITELTPIAPAIWLALWGVAFVVSGYRTLARAVATALLPPVLGFVAGGPLGWIAVPGCVMVLERSREAVRRAWRGEEPKHYWNSAS